MISEGGHYVDGSWLLSIRIDSLSVDRQMRVKGDWSIGRVLVGLTENLSHPPKLNSETTDIPLCPGLGHAGWSEFALWWPAKNRWILQTHASLDQYGLQADARLHFIRTHGRLKIQLPDLQTRVFCDVNFTEPVFRVVIHICKHLGIKHPEELSLQHTDSGRFLNSIHDKTHLWNEQWSTLPASARRSFKKLAFSPPPKHDTLQKRPASCVLASIDHTDKQPRNGGATQTIQRRPQIYGPPRVRNRPLSGTAVPASARPDSLYFSQTLYGTVFSKQEICDDPSLLSSPHVSLSDALSSGGVVRQRSFLSRARFSNLWLELGRSLMEQGLHPSPINLDDCEVLDATDGKENGVNGDKKEVQTELPTLRLRFKYNVFYGLTRKNNSVRINQLYEQARWSIVSEATECTNDEAALFAALQLQLQQVAGEPEHHSSSKEPHSFSLSGEIAVDGQSLSTLPPLYQSPRKQSSQFGSDVFLSRAGRTTSMQDLDHEIDMLLEDLTATCLQKDHSIIRTMTRGEPAQHHFPRRLKVSTGARTDGELALPELATYLKVCKPRMFGIKTYRRFYVVLKKTTLFLFKNQEDFQHSHPPIETICILGCESWPDLSPTADRFAIRIFTPMIRNALPLSSALTRDVTSENATLTTRLKRRASLLSLTSLGGLSAVCGKAVSRVSGLLNEVIIRLPDEAHYVEWWAAVRLAGSLSSCHAAATPETVRRLFDAEKRATTSLLQLLTPLPLKITSLNVDRTSMEDRMWLQRNFTVALPYRLAGEQAGRWGEGTHTWTQGKTVDAGAPGGGSLPPAKEEANERLIRHILDIRSRLPEMKAVDIKLQYISHWQQLTGNGVIYFVARFEASVPIEAALGLPSDTPDQAYRASTLNSSHVHTSTRQLTISVSRRDEVVGIGNGRVARHDQSTGEIYAAWRLDTIQGWNVNRELNELVLLLAPTPNPADRPGDNAASPDASRKSDHPGGGRVIIRPVGVPVQKVSEVLGANVFLSLRSPTKSQELDENLFYRLIGASPAKTVSSNAVR